jgi:hypothetical protein
MMLARGLAKRSPPGPARLASPAVDADKDLRIESTPQGDSMTGSLEAFARTVIVGNGGSGKSWLAGRLGAALSAPAVDLDEIHWLPGGFNARREPAAAIEMVQAKAAEDRWVIEGVYGWLANAALPRATSLIWVDVPIEECIANAKARGLRRGGDEDAFAALIAFIGDYATRTNANSRTAHEQAFSAFANNKVRVATRADMAKLLDGPLLT